MSDTTKKIPEPEEIKFPMHRKADITPDGLYRYSLIRTWDMDKHAVMFIGLNPSTADAEIDDPTVCKCVQYAKRWGYGTLYMTNLFAYRSTDAEGLKDCKDPLGPRNMESLHSFGKRARLVVFAWGANKLAKEQAAIVQTMFPKAMCLKLTKDGAPQHPLYINGNTDPIPYTVKSKN